MTDEMLIAALLLAVRGYAVFPCVPGSKQPLTAHGCKAATTYAKTIQRWWGREPRANIGIATGAPSGLWALDVDLDHGGEDSLAELEGTHGGLPETITSITGGGGRHLLFKHPGVPVRNRVAIRPGVDCRGDGGFIVAPPSVHQSGRRYVWADDGVQRAAEAPGWLLAIVKEPEGTLVVPEARPVVTPSRYAAAAVRRACAAVAAAKPGQRNSTLNSEAFGIGQLVGAGMLAEEDAAFALVLAAFGCGLERDEIESTLRSGLHAGMAKPRGVEMEHV
jgi:hypothetical protein